MLRNPIQKMVPNLQTLTFLSSDYALPLSEAKLLADLFRCQGRLAFIDGTCLEQVEVVIQILKLPAQGKRFV